MPVSLVSGIVKAGQRVSVCGRSAIMDVQKSKRRLVTLRKNERESYDWFEALMKPTRNLAIGERRKKERAQGRQLSSFEAATLSDDLERTQRELNMLLAERDEIVTKLLAHWGHTGIEKIRGQLGETLIYTSLTLGVDQETLRAGATQEEWSRLTDRIVNIPRLLSEANGSHKVRELLRKSLREKRFQVAAVAPSSRRPKSGKIEEEDEDE